MQSSLRLALDLSVELQQHMPTCRVRECACGCGGVCCMPSFSIREYGDSLVLLVESA
jgi:hypothetical protein